MTATTNLYYTKHFTSGNLKGLSVPCHISLPDDDEHRRHYAKAFARGSKHSDCVTKARWIVADVSFQNYAR